MNAFFLRTLVITGLTFIIPQLSTAQQWQQVGKKGDWEHTIDVVALGGKLYSIEKDGTLFKTDKDGYFEQVGAKGAFDNVDVLVALDGEIWTVEDGSLYHNNI
ncbi:MAG: hypothetical protein ABI761_19675, partial [Saprospiraceae bacterium]